MAENSTGGETHLFILTNSRLPCSPSTTVDYRKCTPRARQMEANCVVLRMMHRSTVVERVQNYLHIIIYLCRLPSNCSNSKRSLSSLKRLDFSFRLNTAISILTLILPRVWLARYRVATLPATFLSIYELLNYRTVVVIVVWMHYLNICSCVHLDIGTKRCEDSRSSAPEVLTQQHKAGVHIYIYICTSSTHSGSSWLVVDPFFCAFAIHKRSKCTYL